VQLDAGSPVSEAELGKHVSERLAHFEVPVVLLAVCALYEPAPLR
jgi:hypothetical protein